MVYAFFRPENSCEEAVYALFIIPARKTPGFSRGEDVKELEGSSCLSLSYFSMMVV